MGNSTLWPRVSLMGHRKVQSSFLLLGRTRITKLQIDLADVNEDVPS